MGLKDRLTANAEVQSVPLEHAFPPHLRQEVETVTNVPIAALVPWSDETHETQPFPMYSEEKLDQFAANIRVVGVLVPIIVRPMLTEPGKYQIAAGHNRAEAARRAGYETIPAIVRQLTDDETREVMVWTNIDQDGRCSKPSVLAEAYSIALNARKKQGQRNDLLSTSRQDVEKLSTADQIGKDYGVSGRTIQRMVKLTRLLPPLLALVDSEDISIGVGELLSDLDKERQALVLEVMGRLKKKTVTKGQGEDLKAMRDELDERKITRIFGGEVAKEKRISFSLPASLFRTAIPAELKKDESFHLYLREAIEHYMKEQARQ